MYYETYCKCGTLWNVKHNLKINLKSQHHHKPHKWLLAQPALTRSLSNWRNMKPTQHLSTATPFTINQSLESGKQLMYRLKLRNTLLRTCTAAQDIKFTQLPITQSELVNNRTFWTWEPRDQNQFYQKNQDLLKSRRAQSHCIYQRGKTAAAECLTLLLNTERSEFDIQVNFWTFNNKQSSKGIKPNGTKFQTMSNPAATLLFWISNLHRGICLESLLITTPVSQSQNTNLPHLQSTEVSFWQLYCMKNFNFFAFENLREFFDFFAKFSSLIQLNILEDFPKKFHEVLRLWLLHRELLKLLNLELVYWKLIPRKRSIIISLFWVLPLLVLRQNIH